VAVVVRVALVVFCARPRRLLVETLQRPAASETNEASCTVVVIPYVILGAVEGFGFVLFVLVGSDGRDTGRLVHSLWAKLAAVAGFLALLSELRPVLRMRAPANSRDVRAGVSSAQIAAVRVLLVLARWVSGTRGRNGPEGDCGQK